MLPILKKSYLVLAVTLLASITTWSVYQNTLIQAEPTHRYESETTEQLQQIEQTPKEVVIEAALEPEEKPSMIHSEKDNSVHISYEWEIESYGTIEKEYIMDDSLAKG